MNRNKNLLVAMLSLVIVTAVTTFFATTFFIYRLDGTLFSQNTVSFDSDQIDPSSIRKFKEVKASLKTYFYKDVDENVLLEGAVRGMADSLEDRYTVYYNKEEMETFNERSSGTYVGIGVHISVDESGLISVSSPIDDSPAQKAGILPGDKIVKVDDKDVTSISDWSLVVAMIKGKEGTEVKITVYRPSERRYIDFTLTRKEVKAFNIESEMILGNIGYIRLTMFDNDIATYFGQHLNKLISQGMKGLIIDVRDNPGGSLDQVVAIADRLLPEGLIVYTQNRAGHKEEEKSDATELGYPLTILMNENSASASEVLAGAVKDYKKGTLIGTKSFGKGVVQVVLNLNDGSGLKVTIGRYYTPSGICIQDIGIVPDIEVPLAEEYKYIPASQIPKGEDVQLQKAIEVIKEQVK